MQDILLHNGKLLISSKTVAELFEKQHKHVLRDIRHLLEFENTPTSFFIEKLVINESNKQEYTEYLMTKDGFTLLAMGYTGKRALNFKIKYINKFNELEAALRDDEIRTLSVSSQKKCMKTLQELLPIDEKQEKINYIKANVIVNKAVQLHLNLTSMVKKADMTSEMLILREQIMKDYLKLFDILGNSTAVKEAIYKKYQTPVKLIS